MNLLDIAIKIATEAHKRQFRNDNTTPYITHPLAVMVMQRYLQITLSRNDIIGTRYLITDIRWVTELPPGLTTVFNLVPIDIGSFTDEEVDISYFYFTDNVTPEMAGQLGFSGTYNIQQIRNWLLYQNTSCPPVFGQL